MQPAKKQLDPALSLAASAQASFNRGFASEVAAGLRKSPQKELPSKYLYDEVGSALFEAITSLPEYGVTRAEERLIVNHAAAMIDSLPADTATIAELGSGSGRKTRWLLSAAAARNGAAGVTYCPIEISPSALQQCTRELADIPGVSITPYEADYLDGLARVARARLPGQALALLFLGSTIGNFGRLAATRFLSAVHGMLLPGDALLLGADLAKPVATLIDAYDDPVGVTAAFNLNLLSRINRTLDADFDIRGFEHQARFNPDARSIEMHLRSRRAQQVRVRAADLTVEFRAGETIWTESSHKYTAEEVALMASDAGFDCRRQWVDADWPFAESLLIAR
ncbi:MAG: L-histidine N(alpha)-methyltransferase [Janthinobacterium lividum]